MTNGSIAFADKFKTFCETHSPDAVVLTDFTDLNIFVAHAHETLRRHNTRLLLYMHENQLTIPWSGGDTRGKQTKWNYHFINYSSTILADEVFFNSKWHRDDFCAAVPRLLRTFRDDNDISRFLECSKRFKVLPVGIDFAQFNGIEGFEVDRSKGPVILWNARWDDDKNPEEFFKALASLENRFQYQLVLIGENFKTKNKCFERAKKVHRNRILQYGFVESRREYCRWLKTADILPVTSKHEFFGIAVLEAIYCGARALLPKRLSYPEHFNPEQYPEMFYETFAELCLKLQKMIKFPSSVVNNSTNLATEVAERYDWKRVAKQYDIEFFSPTVK